MVADHRDHLGWARVMVHTQGNSKSGSSPVFEGAFTVNGVTHHVITATNYLRNKHYLDPHISISSEHPDSGLVVWRDSDTLAPHEEDIVRVEQGIRPIRVSPSVRPATCAHDSMNYNTDPIENPALRESHHEGHWYDPFGLTDTSPIHTNRTSKRDDVAGNAMSSK